MIYPAPAKLNLFLHVVGRRADGYHLLQTVFRFLDFGDSLKITLRHDAEIHLLSTLPGVPESQDLCWRAAHLLKRHTGYQWGANISLDKRVPMGGGLGGGSSDAATVLLVLNRLWGLHLPRHELQLLALQLGADVPIFVFGRTAFAEGIGEILTPWTPKPSAYVVMTPPVHLSTPAIFAQLGLTRNTQSIKIADLFDGFGHNDLEPVAKELYPEIVEYFDWLSAYGDVRMTGSGSSLFASFANRAEADKVYDNRPSHMQGFVANGLDQHPLYEFAD